MNPQSPSRKKSVTKQKQKSKHKKPKQKIVLKEYRPGEESRRVMDILEAIRKGETVRTIADQYGVGARTDSILDVVTQAFSEGWLAINYTGKTLLLDQFVKQHFGNLTDFFISPTKHEFDAIAALKILEWIRKGYEKIPAADIAGVDRLNSPFIAVGGGKTISGICREMKSILEKSPDLGNWFNSKPLCITNATSGGQTWEPILESSKLACDMGCALGKDVGVHSVSRPSKTEADLIRMAVKNTFLVLSGIGTPNDSQCVRALVETGIDTDEGLKQKDLAGEFLYHPYTTAGVPVFEKSADWFDVKERLIEQDKHNTVSTSAITNPLLASLFEFNNLKGRPVPNHLRTNWPRYIIAVVKCDEDNLTAKATSLLHLLRNGYLTHFCIPYNLAEELKRVASQLS